jgi:hypothetical protein
LILGEVKKRGRREEASQMENIAVTEQADIAVTF